MELCRKRDYYLALTGFGRMRSDGRSEGRPACLSESGSGRRDSGGSTTSCPADRVCIVSGVFPSEDVGVPVGVPIGLRSNEFRVHPKLHPWGALVRPSVTDSEVSRDAGRNASGRGVPDEWSLIRLSVRIWFDCAKQSIL